ncbi:MAG: MBL fold metallo-hydrolase [Candidatus Sumerlaeota bacterium]|nr:MBL fold metallo-hydrolase [Candidatus Sumerlaeota bacterium]
MDDPRFNEIKARHDRGEKITEEERDYVENVMELQVQLGSVQRNAEYAKAHPPREFTGMIPLTDLGPGLHENEPGGLYPGGVNTPPAAHLQAGLRLAADIVPLDREGRRSADGRIVMAAIGMSNTTQASRTFLKLLDAVQGLNPRLTVVDCAQGSQTAHKIADPNFPYWGLVNARLENAGATLRQVQVVWLKEANNMPTEPFLEHVRKFQGNLVDILHNLHDKFPNLKIAYLSSRIYGGYAVGPLNPEPFAYEEGFAVKWLIADQIAGKPELNYDPAKGPVRAPWIAWGPYLWADGLKGRLDGLVWTREDLSPDGTHPSLLGREKVAKLLMEFLKRDPTARPWFVGRGVPSRALQQIVPGVWFREETGSCNSIVIEMNDYLIVVDASYPGPARALISDVQKTFSKPIKYVIDTHSDEDHLYGNAVFTKIGAITIAHAGLVEDMRQYEPRHWQRLAKFRKDVADLNLPGPEPPQQTFTDSPYVISDSNRRVELRHFGWGHTRGDVFVYLPKEKILCAGDSVGNGAWGDPKRAHMANWANQIRAAAKLDVELVLPGHGSPGGKELLEGQIEFFEELYKAVQAAVKEGKTLDQLVTMRDGRPVATAIQLSPKMMDEYVSHLGPVLKPWQISRFPSQVRNSYVEIVQGRPYGEIAGDQ